jgi:hypothetical protein
MDLLVLRAWVGHRLEMSKYVTLVAAAVVLVACVAPPQQGARPAPGQGQLQAPAAAGTYVATLDDGQQLKLVLAADGQVYLGGDSGYWAQDGQSIVLIDQDGSEIYGVLSGDQLVFELMGGTLHFVRAGPPAGQAGMTGQDAHAPGGFEGGQADDAWRDEGHGGPPVHGNAGDRGASAAPAKPFAPAETLRGRRVQPEGAGFSMTVPAGWQHSWQEGDDGARAYTLVAPQSAGRGAILIRQSPLGPGEAQLPITSLMQRGLPELIGHAPAQTVLAPEAITVEGSDAGRMIVTVTAPNGQPLEIYLGAVRADGWAHVVAGVYDAALGDRYRPGVDTVLASFRGGAPPPNRQLAQLVIGCWQQYQGDTGSTGNAWFERRIQIAPSGTFSYRSTSSVSVSGAGATRDSRDQGTWYAAGDSLYATGENGQVSTYTVRRDGGVLYLNGERYLPCQ